MHRYILLFVNNICKLNNEILEYLVMDLVRN